jgi:ribosomal-protein-alanine N-acetyltransferase
MSNSMGLPETNRTERLTLRRPRSSDAAGVFAYASDPDVTLHMDWVMHTDMLQSRAYLDFCDAGWARGYEATWAITLGDDDRLIGVISARPRGHKADFGYALTRAHWGKGIATEASRAVIEELFRLPEIARVWATCSVDNVASRRVLEKSGLQREGILHAWCVRPQKGGVVEDSCCYAIVRR